MTNTLIDMITEQRKASLAEMQTIVAASEARGTVMTAAEQARFDQCSADMDASAARITAIKATQHSEAEQARVLTDLLGANAGGQPAPATWLPSARKYAEQAAEQRATGFSAAGAVLLTQQYNQWFDRLRNSSVFLEAFTAVGGRIVPVDGRALSVPIVNTSVTVANIDENGTITPSDLDLDPVVLTPVKFAALTQVSNESLSDANPILGQIVAEDLIRSVATAIDAALLTGAGGTGPVKVLGLRNKVGITNTLNTLLGVDGAVPTLDTFADMVALLEGVNGNPETAAFFITPGVWNVVRKVKAIANGNYHVQPDVTSAAKRSLFGVPVYVTANLPQNEVKGTSGATTSSIILADMSRVVVGVGQDVIVRQSEDFAFNADQTAVRVTARFDVQALNEAAIVVTKGAKLS